MTGLVERVRKAISPSRGSQSHESSPSTTERPLSPVDTSADPGEERGRTTHQQQRYTTGRGGAGNIVKSSHLVDPNQLSSEDNRVAREERSRRALSPRSHGRGGAGNIRSPSRDANQRAQQEDQLRKLDAEDRRIEEAYDERKKNAVHSTGRGGAGNIH